MPKLLKETEVYIKYGLHEKALEHLRKIFSADPDNIEAHDKAKAVALATGRNEDAIASLETVLRLSVERGDPRADEARAELRQLDPGNPADLPKVSFWSVWNEPDYGPGLAPQGVPGHVKIENSPPFCPFFCGTSKYFVVRTNCLRTTSRSLSE